MRIVDLEPYITFYGKTVPGVFAIGWLGVDAQFPTCKTISSEFVLKLNQILFRCRTAVARGRYLCPFCRVSFEEMLESIDNPQLKLILAKNKPLSNAPISNPFSNIEVTDGQTSLALGSGEIWVPGRSAIYAAPDLISHYVTNHAYCPPKQFIEAVNEFEMGSSWDASAEYAKNRK